MTAAQKDLREYIRKLQRNGFTIESKVGHFKIRSPQGQLFTCSSSPSCPHAWKNLDRDIRKYSKTPFVFEDEKPKERKMQFNTPTIKIEPARKEIPQLQKAINSEATIRRKGLDKEALEICLKYKENRKTQVEMSEALNALNYGTSTGAPLRQENISYFLRENGHGYFDKEKSQGKSRVKVVSQSTLIQDIEEILTTNMSDPLKEKFILQLVKEKLNC